MFMTDLVHGHEEIHVFMEHLADELVEAKVLDLEVVKVDDLVDYNGHASYYEDEVDYDGDYSDHYYDHATYEDDDHYNYDFHDNDDEFG
nr:hypothetical protein CFP56_01509 [Quercus suber]